MNSNYSPEKIIEAAYRRFLLRICNEKISVYKFVFNLKISPTELGLSNKQNLNSFFSKFDYEDFPLNSEEVKYLISVNQNYNDFDGRSYDYYNFKYLKSEDIYGCYNRFLLRYCKKDKFI